MLEGSIMEYVKWLIIIFSLFFVSVVVMGMFKLNEVNSFQQEVNYQIERNGGLTEQAIANLNDFVEEAYGSCVIGMDDPVPEGCKDPFRLREFVINDDDSKTWYDRGDEKAPFGTQIHYVIKRTVGQVQGMPVFEPTVIGTSASRVRGD